MNRKHNPKVAVLLATYNGARFVEAQIQSLAENATPFTLHWIDDHSTDNTRELVRSSALSSGIELCEWHETQRYGCPGTFFQLLEQVEADIYLFCDQDDIWQRNKIDATVAHLIPDLAAPAFCFSDCFVFDNDAPKTLQRLSDVVGATAALPLQDSRAFMVLIAPGHTQGFTRPLREIFLRHKDVARSYSLGHDCWMYLIAAASGKCHMLPDVPTTLYRWHGTNVSGSFFGARRIGEFWRVQQSVRPGVARQAEGFILASKTLPPGPKVEKLLNLAHIVKKLNRRLSPVELLRLVRSGAMWPNTRHAFWLAAACLCSNARLPSPSSSSRVDESSATLTES